MCMGMLGVGSVWIKSVRPQCVGVNKKNTYRAVCGMAGSFRRDCLCLSPLRSAWQCDGKEEGRRHTARGCGPPERIWVLPLIQQLLRCLEYILQQSALLTAQPISAFTPLSYLLLSWITDILVGIKQGPDIHCLSPPNASLNSPVKRQFERPAV